MQFPKNISPKRTLPNGQPSTGRFGSKLGNENIFGSYRTSFQMHCLDTMRATQLVW